MWPAPEKPDQQALENYTLNEVPDGTELFIDVTYPVTEETKTMKDMFEVMWPKALLKLKEISEK